MALNTSIPWHRESWDRFINQRLPRLIEERLPLVDYRVDPVDEYAVNIALTVKSEQDEVGVEYANLPQPSADGIFRIDGSYRVVVPYPSERSLDRAEICCVGEQLHDFFEQRLGEPPQDMSWDAETVRIWLPLASWMREFHGGLTSQYLRLNNWLDRYTHLRRITLVPIEPDPLLPGSSDITSADYFSVFPRQQLGWVCPFAQPEGPNVGRILEVARGAEIRDGRLIRIDESPASHLGFNSSMVPFLEHDDTNRALMGANMMRQYMAASDPNLPVSGMGWFGSYHERALTSEGTKPEPALVQTGEEPSAAPDFWGGYNLLTAFITWDGDAFDDGIILSESCARRLDFPMPVEIGDKLANRHGAKGIVSRILPDEKMPALPNGTAVELIYNLTSLPSRMNFGQVRECVMGRIAQAEGQPAIVPPFAAPDDDEIVARLKAAGLPADGMEQLSVDGEKLAYRSTVGCVYWGRLVHTAREKLCFADGSGLPVGMLACQTMVECGALANLHDLLNTNSVAQPDGWPSGPAAPPSPRFARLQEVLGFAGISVSLRDEQLTLSFVEATGVGLASPVPHPWLAEKDLNSIGALDSLSSPGDDLSERFEDVLEANARVERIMASNAPRELQEPAIEQLQTRVRELFQHLLPLGEMLFQTQVRFGGTAVIAPGPELNWDQVGLPEEMAWSLFGPQVAGAIQDEGAVEKRSRQACEALDEIMSHSWVLLYNGREAAGWGGTGIRVGPVDLVAFHPLRQPDPVVRVNTRVCPLMERDFDGDQIAVILPCTAGAQREAGERLSLVAHLKRDSRLFRHITGNFQGALWGLARLNFTETGRRELGELVGEVLPDQLLTSRRLHDLLMRILTRDGVESALDMCQALLQRGFTECKRAGGSFGPFFGSGVELPVHPSGADLEEWKLHKEESFAAFLNATDFDDDQGGAIALLNRTGARGSRHQLGQYLGAQGPLFYREDGTAFVIERNFREGLTPEELLNRTPGAIRGLASINMRWLSERAEDPGVSQDASHLAGDYHALGRALRSHSPGVAFARAAARNEVDPLEDAVVRILVGLPLEKGV